MSLGTLGTSSYLQKQSTMLLGIPGTPPYLQEQSAVPPGTPGTPTYLQEQSAMPPGTPGTQSVSFSKTVAFNAVLTRNGLGRRDARKWRAKSVPSEMSTV